MSITRVFYGQDVAKRREGFFADSTFSNLNGLFLGKFFEKCKGGRVLDIGTGNGFVLEQLARTHPWAGYILHGLDISPDMIEIARKRTQGLDIGFYVGDNNSIPFADNFFAAVTAKNVTNFSAQEVHRVLQPEGTFFFREYGEGKGLVEIAELFRERLINSRSPKHYAEQLSKVGFGDIQVDHFRFKINFTYDRLIQTIKIFPFIRDFKSDDEKEIARLFKSDIIEVTSDPFILTTTKK